MTQQEKIIIRFLLGALIVGVFIGYARRTWFKETITAARSVEIQQAGITAVVESRERSGTEHVSGPINLNTATKSELMSLPGIGSKISERIMLFRQDHGNFQSIEDLTKVKGIGSKMLARFREKVII